MNDVMDMQDMYCREIIEIKERPRHDNLKKKQKIQTKKSKRQK